MACNLTRYLTVNNLIKFYDELEPQLETSSFAIVPPEGPSSKTSTDRSFVVHRATNIIYDQVASSCSTHDHKVHNTK
jgi:hypothetical protein